MVGSRNRGVPYPRTIRGLTTTGCSRSFEEGSLYHLVMRRRIRGEGRSFTHHFSTRAELCHRINRSSPQATVGSMRRPQAMCRRAVAFGVQPPGVLVSVVGRASLDFAWLTARHLREKVASACRAPSKEGTREAGANTWVLPANSLDGSRAVRVGRSHGCARAS